MCARPAALPPPRPLLVSFFTQAISPRTADLFVDQDTGELAFHFGRRSSEDCISGTNAVKKKKKIEMQPLLLQAVNL